MTELNPSLDIIENHVEYKKETPEEVELRRARRREWDRQVETAEQAESRQAIRRQNDRHRKDYLSNSSYYIALDATYVVLSGLPQDTVSICLVYN